MKLKAFFHCGFPLLVAGTGCAAPDKPLQSSTEVSFQADGLQLNGTLSMPAGSSSHVPAMLLLPGSGPTDRDGNAGNGVQGFHPDLLKQIAENLAAHGVATFRFDKRAMVSYRDKWPTDLARLGDYFAYDHFIKDAESAFEFLRSRPGIDRSRVGILGHSEGGLFAMQIAADQANSSEAPWRVVLMSAGGRPFGPIVHDQLTFRLHGAVPDKTATQWIAWWDAAAVALAKDKAVPPDQPKALASLVNPSAIKLMGAYCRIDPVTLVRGKKIPFLVMNGSDDTQVSPTRDANRLFGAILDGPHSSLSKEVIVKGVSHNYKSTKDGNRDAIDGSVNPEALKSIVGFLQSR